MDASPNESKTKTDQIPEKEDKTEILHVPGSLNSDDLYALPNKKKYEISEMAAEEESGEEDDDEEEEKGKQEEIENIEEKDVSKDLPPGWEKHEGKNSFVYRIPKCVN